MRLPPFFIFPFSFLFSCFPYRLYAAHRIPAPVKSIFVKLLCRRFFRKSLFYYLVKADGDFGVLESDVYMDREVVEVAVCEDAENTMYTMYSMYDSAKNGGKEFDI